MKDNKEIKIAAVVGAFMLIFCVVMIQYASNNSEVPEEEILKNSFMVYKNTTVDGKRAYTPCTVPASDLNEIQAEYQKIINATENSTASNITGTYRVGTENDFIAFDEDNNNNVFIKSKNKLYNIESTLYEKVINLCK